jgi:hypothetical protein
MPVRVRVRFPSDWEFVDRVREFGGFFCEKAFAAGIADRVRVVIQEALENAMRHPSASTHREVELTISNEGLYLEIEITCLPGAGQIKSLMHNVATVSSLPPKQAFIAALGQLATDPGGLERVGLARMRYEAAMDLVAEEREDGSLRFSAKGLL